MNKKDIASKKYRCLYEAKREQYVEYLKIICRMYK